MFTILLGSFKMIITMFFFIVLSNDQMKVSELTELDAGQTPVWNLIKQ